MNILRNACTGLLFLAVLSSGCEQAAPRTEQQKKEKKQLEGSVKHHRSDGSLASEIQYKDKKKHGLAKAYYKNEKLKSEIMYAEDVQHGIAKMYYENGKLYRETSYKMGKKDGLQKVYRENGKLLAEIPYKQDQLGVGTVEYTPEGKPKKQLPKIKVEHIDQLLKNNHYIVRISLTEGYKNVDYYIGDLTEGKYKNADLMRMVPEGGIVELKYYLPPGTFLMESINVVAETKTQMRSPYLLQQKINIAAENKGF